MNIRAHASTALALQLLLAVAAVSGAARQAARDAGRISAVELHRELRTRHLAVVDVRRDEEFIGWQLRGEPRGGHIPGAVQLPAEWLVRKDGSPEAPARIRAFLARGGVAAGDRLVIATTGEERAAHAYHALRRAGFASVWLIEGGLESWLRDARLPLEQLPGHRMLVPPAWLDAVRLGGTVAEPPEGPVTVLEVSWGGPEKKYGAGHIPGAIHLDTNEIEADKAVEPRGYWRLLPPAQLQAALEQLGITKDSTVVLYSDPSMAAARAAWALMYAGVRDVRVLNGGLAAWKRDGLAVETQRVSPGPRRAFGATVPTRPDLRRSATWVRDHLFDSGENLADVRSWEEFTGRVTGYDEVTRMGRIPGARWAQGGSNPSTLVGDYEDEDGTFRAYTEVAAMWRARGFAPEVPMTFYCGTGWRASVSFLFAQMMERPRPAIYDSGWMDWSMGPAAPLNPVARGDPALGRGR